MGNPKGQRRDFDALERRRLRAVSLFEEGLGQSEVARRLRVPRQTTHRWHKVWKQEGEAALKKAGRAGRKARLSAEQNEQLVAALLAGPRANGFETDVWTLPRMARLVEQLCGITYHPDHMSRLMKQLGFSCQRPAKRARERDEKQIAAWKRTVWPRIKKKPEKSDES
jgi:transposase